MRRNELGTEHKKDRSPFPVCRFPCPARGGKYPKNRGAIRRTWGLNNDPQRTLLGNDPFWAHYDRYYVNTAPSHSPGA